MGWSSDQHPRTPNQVPARTSRTPLVPPRTYVTTGNSYIPSELKKVGSKSNKSLSCK